jgi:hypothetical protein
MRRAILKRGREHGRLSSIAGREPSSSCHRTIGHRDGGRA